LLFVCSRFQRKPSWKASLGIGVLLGLAALFRQNSLALLPVIWLWILWVQRASKTRETAAPRARAWSTSLALAVGCMLAVAPSAMRHALISGEWIPITVGGGINLYIGNNPAANGRVAADLPGIGRFQTCYD
jgi:4-amino-4-deoxy-L-arabinose transferase-like glycosyltransferase